MKVYVASSWRNAFQPDVVRELRAAGHEVYDFREPQPGEYGFSWHEIDRNIPPGPADLHLSAVAIRDMLDHPRARDGFDLDMGALRDCDACVLVLPCGRSAHLEAGWAAGAGKRVVVLLGDGEPDLMWKMADVLAVDVDEVLDALAGRVSQPEETGTRELGAWLTAIPTLERIALVLHRIDRPSDKREWGELPRSKQQALLWDAEKVGRTIAASLPSGRGLTEHAGEFLASVNLRFGAEDRAQAEALLSSVLDGQAVWLETPSDCDLPEAPSGVWAHVEAEPGGLLEATRAATALAERYGDAIIRISAVLSDPRLGAGRRINRARTIIAGVDMEAARPTGETGAVEEALLQVGERLKALGNGPGPDRDERYQDAWRCGVDDAHDVLAEFAVTPPDESAPPAGETGDGRAAFTTEDRDELREALAFAFRRRALKPEVYNRLYDLLRAIPSEAVVAQRGETGDGRELREFWLMRNRPGASRAVAIGAEIGGWVVAGEAAAHYASEYPADIESIRVREIPSEGGSS